MKNVGYTCKLCGKPGLAEYSDDTPTICVSRLERMLVCQPCADRRTKFHEAQDQIFASCDKLMRAKQRDLEEAQINVVRNSMRKVIEGACVRYQEVMAEYRNIDFVLESSLASSIIAEPGKAQQILRDYRLRLKQRALTFTV